MWARGVRAYVCVQCLGSRSNERWHRKPTGERCALTGCSRSRAPAVAQKFGSSTQSAAESLSDVGESRNRLHRPIDGWPYIAQSRHRPSNQSRETPSQRQLNCNAYKDIEFTNITYNILQSLYFPMSTI